MDEDGVKASLSSLPSLSKAAPLDAGDRRVAILQSNYLPWRGYFDLIHDVDLFIFYDDVQYTHSDWRHRNKLMTKDGPRWLTIPAGHDLKRLICEVEITDQSWKQKHRSIIEQNYRSA